MIKRALALVVFVIVMALTGTVAKSQSLTITSPGWDAVNEKAYAGFAWNYGSVFNAMTYGDCRLSITFLDSSRNAVGGEIYQLQRKSQPGNPGSQTWEWYVDLDVLTLFDRTYDTVELFVAIRFDGEGWWGLPQLKNITASNNTYTFYHTL